MAIKTEDELATELAAKLIAEHRATKPQAPVSAPVTRSASFLPAAPQRAQRRTFAQMAASKRSDLQAVPYLAQLIRSRFDPRSALATAKREGENPLVIRALSESIFDQGGALVPEVMADQIIEELYNESTVLMAGPMRLTTSTGSLTLPKQVGKAANGWVGELQSSVSSQPGTGAVRMDLKKIMGNVLIPNDLIADSPYSVEEFVRTDLLAGIAENVDKSFLTGVGSAHSPKGLTAMAIAANKFNSAGSTSVQVKGDLYKMRGLIKKQLVPLRNPAFFLNTTGEQFLLGLIDAAGISQFEKDMIERQKLIGIPYFVSEAVPAGTVILAEMSQIVYLEGVGGQGMRLESFREGAIGGQSALEQDATFVRCIQRVDLAARQDGKEVSVMGSVSWS